jgi:hypothetical protein
MTTPSHPSSIAPRSAPLGTSTGRFGKRTGKDSTPPGLGVYTLCRPRVVGLGVGLTGAWCGHIMTGMRFIIGLFIGATLGVFTASLACAAGRAA